MRVDQLVRVSCQRSLHLADLTLTLVLSKRSLACVLGVTETTDARLLFRLVGALADVRNCILHRCRWLLRVLPVEYSVKMVLQVSSYGFDGHFLVLHGLAVGVDLGANFPRLRHNVRVANL